MTPISLLAYMMVIRIVFGVMAAFNIVQIDAAVLLHRQIGDFVAVFFQALAGVEHSLVLDGLGDDVIALFAVHLRDALDHQVVGFGGAAGEDDFLRRGADQRGDLLARRFHGFFAGPAEASDCGSRHCQISR